MDYEYINIKIRKKPLGREMNKAIQTLKDELGLPLYKSRSDLVEAAIRLLLRQHLQAQARSDAEVAEANVRQ